MRFAYVDPPYLGLAKKFYSNSHPNAADYDNPEKHRELIGNLCADFPDGWFMHLHLPSLRAILPMLPEKARVCAWTKPFCSFKKGVHVAYAWEPVILFGGRKPPPFTRTVRDYCAVNIAMKKGLRGAKPAGVVTWALNLLFAEPSDEIVDMFPGSGSVTAAIEEWRKAIKP